MFTHWVVRCGNGCADPCCSGLVQSDFISDFCSGDAGPSEPPPSHRPQPSGSLHGVDTDRNLPEGVTATHSLAAVERAVQAEQVKAVSSRFEQSRPPHILDKAVPTRLFSARDRGARLRISRTAAVVAHSELLAGARAGTWAAAPT